MADRATQLLFFLKDGDFRTGPGQVEGRRHARGASADDRHLGLRQMLLLHAPGHEGTEALAGGGELGFADVHALVVEVSGCSGSCRDGRRWCP